MQQQNLNINQFKEGQIVHIPIQIYPERKFQINKLLGDGAEGTVFSAQSFNWDQNQQYAIKIHKTLQSEKYISFVDSLIKFQNQYENLFNSTHYPTYIIRTYEQFFIDQNVLVIIMEQGNMDLFELQKSNANIDLQTIGNYCIQMAKSIQFLHQYQYIHRDIKPENYIIVGQQIKLIDFGLIKNNKNNYNNNNFQNTIYVGTPLFQAPELATGKADYTQAVDIWSLGCVFYELIKKEALFHCKFSAYQLADSFNETTQLIINHLENQNYAYSKINQLQISDVWKQTILQMLNPLPQNRPTIQDVIQKIEKNNIAFNTIFSNSPENFVFSTQTNGFRFQNTNLNPQNSNFNTQNANYNANQNICQQINNLVQTFQSQNFINQIKQGFLTKQQIEKLIEPSKEVIDKFFSNGNQSQGFHKEVQTSFLDIQDMIEFAQQLLKEIKKDQDLLTEAQNQQVLDLHAKKEQLLQLIYNNEQKFSQIQTLQNDGQKLKSELVEKFNQQMEDLENQKKSMMLMTQSNQQKNQKDENHKSQQQDNIEQIIKNQRAKILELQIKLQSTLYLEDLYRKNKEEIEQLEKGIAEKQNISEQLNQSTTKLSQLKAEEQILTKEQQDFNQQQKEIYSLEDEIQMLKQKRDQLLNESDIKNQLNIKIMYLNQNIAELQTEKQDLNEKLDGCNNQIQIQIQSRQENGKKQQELQTTLKQLELGKIQLEKDEFSLIKGEEQILQLKKEIQTRTEQFQQRKLQQDQEIEKLISKKYDLDQQHSDLDFYKQKIEKQDVLQTEPIFQRQFNDQPIQQKFNFNKNNQNIQRTFQEWPNNQFQQFDKFKQIANLNFRQIQKKQ